jgi:hypothetical protein
VILGAASGQAGARVAHTSHSSERSLHWPDEAVDRATAVEIVIMVVALLAMWVASSSRH